MSKKYLGLAIFTAGLLSSGCSSSSSGGDVTTTDSVPEVKAKAILTFSKTGVIPVLKNSLSTTASLSLYNNSDETINGIKLSGEYLNLAESGLFVSDTSTCQNLGAKQSCVISFKLPTTMSSVVENGSAQILANYKDSKGVSHRAGEILKFKFVSDPELGVLSEDDSSKVSGFGNDVGYGTVYYYVGGVNQKYKVTNFEVNGAEVIGGDLKGQDLSSGEIASVEYKVNQVAQGNQDARISLTSKIPNAGTYQSSYVLQANQNVGSYVLGTDVVKDASESDGDFVIAFKNYGDDVATGLNIVIDATQYMDFIEWQDPVCASSGIAIGNICVAKFKLKNFASGTQVVKLNYNGSLSGETFVNVLWYNSKSSIPQIQRSGSLNKDTLTL